VQGEEVAHDSSQMGECQPELTVTTVIARIDICSLIKRFIS